MGSYYLRNAERSQEITLLMRAGCGYPTQLLFFTRHAGHKLREVRAALRCTRKVSLETTTRGSSSSINLFANERLLQKKPKSGAGCGYNASTFSHETAVQVSREKDPREMERLRPARDGVNFSGKQN